MSKGYCFKNLASFQDNYFRIMLTESFSRYAALIRVSLGRPLNNCND